MSAESSLPRRGAPSAAAKRRPRASVKWPWIAGCIAIAPASALLGYPSWGFDRGRWNCEVCARTEQRISLYGVPVWWESLPPSDAAYAAWWSATIDVEHDHTWRAIGCHTRGRGIACALYRTPLFAVFDHPAIPRSEYRAAAVALASADGSTRRGLLRDLLQSICDDQAERRADPGAAIGLLRARSTAWDRAIAAVEAAEPR